ncbi:hypothetical protein UNSW2_979 [Campylobacter concisus UNSW2]|uniref:Uncharacterized protein n=1 Tax=Campylobacter concisus UNSW2 TaxID=1242965 RepID=U2FLT6_9BACT|nr:hypothetical protein UNSW2_979 [Campylobacter concisus UNSW2]
MKPSSVVTFSSSPNFKVIFYSHFCGFATLLQKEPNLSKFVVI